MVHTKGFGWEGNSMQTTENTEEQNNYFLCFYAYFHYVHHL